jgi:AcrR family transcriptional regulator
VPVVSADVGLRERKKQRTRQLLADTARRLFSERGFENVSVAEIARVAEVSEATVFNYFATKEDLVYSGLEAFEAELLDAIRGRPPGETVISAFREFVLAPRGFFAEVDEGRAQELMAATRMIAASPSLLAREVQIFARYTESLAGLIARETAAPKDDLQPYVVANALIGVHRALISYVRSRLEQEPPPGRRRLASDVRDRGSRALALLEEGLNAYAQKRP